MFSLITLRWLIRASAFAVALSLPRSLIGEPADGWASEE